MPKEKKDAIHQALKHLAGQDHDGARELNGVGFNKFDSEFGAKLASAKELTDRQAEAGERMLGKYKNQLGDELHGRISGKISQGDGPVKSLLPPDQVMEPKPGDGPVATSEPTATAPEPEAKPAPYDHHAAIAKAVDSAPSGMPALDEMRKAYALHHTEINRHLGKQAAEKEGREVAREADPKKLLAIMEHERGMHENRDFIHEPHYRPLVNHIKALRSLTGIKDEPEPVKPTGEHTRVKPDQANHTSLGTDHQHWHTISVPAGKHRVTIRGTNDPTKPAYLARLTGTDPRWQFKREFVRPMPTLGKDDHHGVDLGDGVYEARTGDASGKLDQRLFKVTDGKLTHLHLSNVGAHLPIDTGPSKPWDEEKDGPVPFQATDTVKTWSV